jgi:hypothetical protein
MQSLIDSHNFLRVIRVDCLVCNNKQGLKSFEAKATEMIITYTGVFALETRATESNAVHESHAL